MGRSRQDVGGYRGRRTITDILRWIAIALTVAVVLVVGGVVYLQQYVVYTPDGARLELPPFLQSLRQKPEDSAGDGVQDPGDASQTGAPEDPGPEEDPGQDGDASQEPEPEPAGFALALTVEEIQAGTAAAKVEQSGASSVVVEIKDQMGLLAWPSGQSIAGWSYVNGSQQAADALRQWNAGEVYTIARIHCFRDDTVPYYNNRLALRWAGTDWNWRDELGLRWTSPGQADVRAYNAALCGEAAALGFDEIVLEDFHFPILGKLDTIRVGESYNASQFANQVEDFLTQVQAAAEPYGTKVSLRVSRDTLAGLESVSGVTGSLVERFAWRVWVEDDGLLPEPLELLEQAGITGGQDRLVLITSAHGEENGILQAELLPPPAGE